MGGSCKTMKYYAQFNNECHNSLLSLLSITCL